MRQFPLAPVHAVTVHKVQGETLDVAIVRPKPIKQMSGLYVAFSRVQQQQGLFLIGKVDIVSRLNETRRGAQNLDRACRKELARLEELASQAPE